MGIVERMPDRGGRGRREPTYHRRGSTRLLVQWVTGSRADNVTQCATWASSDRAVVKRSGCSIK